ncbi:uncharacterized protein K444DRAFT_386823 [Hyaloscypha bicolor E]|uniref:Uncharacterized protein n=1 Tax=Hyaloscypha bicolor E TaxID=1095630 RepID=A0A2J6TC74_9HELO|nr:uncharacterized protein K444DRAFT_386823 [Hyaloscypha bicolor E]PMD60629.1 hypothetical protein K444DRAFT_386823 [Hyaloscypha bicolor E]
MAKHPLHLKNSSPISSTVELFLFVAFCSASLFLDVPFGPALSSIHTTGGRRLCTRNLTRPLSQVFENNDRDYPCKYFKTNIRSLSALQQGTASLLDCSFSTYFWTKWHHKSSIDFLGLLPFA